MAHTLSANKRVRQSAKRRRRNKHFKSIMKGSIAAALPAEGKAADAATIKRACREVDRAAAKGVIHPNTAARRKSRLMRSAAAKPAAK